MKKINNFLGVFAMIILLSAAMANMFDIPGPLAFIGTLALSGVLSFIPMPQGIIGAVVLKQLWEAELVKQFRQSFDWLMTIPNKDNYVDNDAINIVEIGIDPEVLIDNQIFPIPMVDRNDDTIIIALKKFDTTNTPIKDDDLYALPYDKNASVIAQHKEALSEKTGEYALFNLCVSGNTANTPVINTTGANNGSGRKRLLPADLITMKKKLDDLKIPKKGRIIVLCNDHIEDLLTVSEVFQKQYVDITEGKVLRLYGFDIYESTYNPVFDAANAKKAWGAAAAGTDRNASVVIYPPRAAKATGTVKMYYAKAENDPSYRQSVVGFSLRHIVLPIKNIGFGAIVSNAA